MIKEKKIALQAKIIKDLQNEKKELLNRINELENIVSDNEAIIKDAKTYRDEHTKTIESLIEAREKYLQAHKAMVEQKNEYKKEMDNLLKTIKKNT